MTVRSGAAGKVKEKNQDLLHHLADQLHGGRPPALQLFSLQMDKVSPRETKVRVSSGFQKPHKAQRAGRRWETE